MTRKTNLTTQVGIAPFPSQRELDTFWNWIDGTPATDELWKVEANGDMVLVVDEETLTSILFEDETKAYEDFEVFEEREADTGAWVVHNLPYELLGTYTVRGVYNAKQELVTEDVTYFFSQEF